MRLSFILFLAIPTPLAAADNPLDPAAVEFFEKKIRPALTEHCAVCHSADAASKKKLKAALYLDSKAGVLKGGDSGPVLVPGKPAASLLIKAMKYEGDTKMPPKGKLPDSVIAAFEKWVAMGAPDSRGDTVNGSRRQVVMSIEDGRKFWAFRPMPPLPSRGSIDEFILAGLKAKGRAFAPAADRATLVRRVCFDLIGLPPSPEEVDRFVNDSSQDAYERLVDSLLTSPRFGERWGRHWLDVARFAESVTLRGFVFKEAWRYRDYVIDSFNADLPFDRFINEQIAGDLLAAATNEAKARQITATTFLALGNTNLEEQDKKQLRMDVVDEQLDVISKGFLAQTVTCARCHDHKFDPIPTKDYYALAGILRNTKAMEHANVSKWVEVPLPAPPVEEAAIKKQEEAVAALQALIKTVKAKSPAVAATGVLAVKDVPGIVVDDAQAKKVGEWIHSKFNSTYIGDGYVHDKDMGKGEKTITFQPEAVPPGKYEVRLAYSPGANRANGVPVHVFSADGEKTVIVDMKKYPPIDGRYVSLGEYQFEKNGPAYVLVTNEDTKGHVTPDAVVFTRVDSSEIAKMPDNASSANRLKTLEAELKRLQETGPKRKMVMSVVEEKQIEDTKVHVRGNVHNLGEVAPRGFIAVANLSPTPTIPKGESGRKELAEWIASKNNPLTSRVIVNRAWHWLFGSGIVRTVDNFGTTGETPSHPELLDHLAATFVQDGWSVKKLVRRIVLSRTYQQGAGDVAEDPENRLFGRANRRRLEAEVIRDTMLVVSGKLDLTPHGPTFPASLVSDYGYKTESVRRSVYLPAFRNALPEALEVFDAADTSMVTGRRNTTTGAPQALFMMNHPFVLEQARNAATKLLADKPLDDSARVVRAYRWTLGRTPSESEKALATTFLSANNDVKEAWAAVFHALFASADFRYVD